MLSTVKLQATGQHFSLPRGFNPGYGLIPCKIGSVAFQARVTSGREVYIKKEYAQQLSLQPHQEVTVEF